MRWCALISGILVLCVWPFLCWLQFLQLLTRRYAVGWAKTTSSDTRKWPWFKTHRIWQNWILINCWRLQVWAWHVNRKLISLVRFEHADCWNWRFTTEVSAYIFFDPIYLNIQLVLLNWLAVNYVLTTFDPWFFWGLTRSLVEKIIIKPLVFPMKNTCTRRTNILAEK